ncbi:cytochrome b [Methylomonas methanica]|uniref:Cytochrome b561 n=1 Tax=Methylomonas methanica (strain DSM 25384 / MC09) TaxID=857087 RepID=G0A142_METMM|nr:cytochrome b [Methylomonas methanica]AEG01298.1 cytochrome b561 [Methylomonas methanica MC09]
MTWKNTSIRYGSLNIALHWLIFVLIASAYAFILLRELFPKGSDPRETMKTLHFMLGLSVLLLVLPRIAMRFVGSTPSITPEPPAWQHSAARLAHLALYVFMIIMPLLGWLMLSAAGKPIPFYGLQLPALIDEDKELAKFIKEIHETIGEIGYYLIGLHALAALYHHFIQRDNSLLNMLPAAFANRLKLK